MKADLTANVGDSNADGEQTEVVADPFAVDLFAAHRPLASAGPVAGQPNQPDETEEQASVDRSRSWRARLPRFSRAQAQISNLLSTVAPALSATALAALARVLARYTHTAAGEVSLTTVDLRDREFESSIFISEMRPRVWASLAIAPDEARIAADVEAGFAAGIIDRMLGGNGTPPDTLRALSRTEQSVVEFLWLSLIHELNEEIGEPLWRLDGITAQPPAWLTSRQNGQVAAAPAVSEINDAAARRGLVATVRVHSGIFTGLVRFYLTPEALSALDGVRNPLLFGERGRDPRVRLAQFAQITPDIRLRFILGETQVTAADLAQLEPGDVVVIAHPWARWHGRQFAGRLEACVGDGRSPILAGTITPAAEPQAPPEGNNGAVKDAATLKLLIETIRRGETSPATEHLRMEEEGTADASESAIALDEILLTVHVELAQRRISLDELSRLRVGQLLELGCKATDPVDLIAEGRRIARGELIEIEGQLGVRLTQLAS